MKVAPIRRVQDVRSIKKMLNGSPREFCLFVLGINTNLRASDLLRITIGQVRGLKAGDEIEIIEKKTKKRRRITLNDEVINAIGRLLDLLGSRHCDDDRLFQGQRGPMTVNTVTRLVKHWCAAINLDGNFGSHTMRKTFGYHQRTRLNTSIPELMVMFNHSNQRQTLDYLCVQAEEIHEAYMKLTY
jgi:integrase